MCEGEIKANHLGQGALVAAQIEDPLPDSLKVSLRSLNYGILCFKEKKIFCFDFKETG